MAQKGDLMTARSDIRVLDATIRDGGLVNNFMFSDDFINALYRTNVKAGVYYMEFGYKASKELFDVNKFGKWKFSDEENIRAIVGDNNSDMKLAIKADEKTPYKVIKKVMSELQDMNQNRYYLITSYKKVEE